MSYFDEARINMVDGQVRPAGVIDERILSTLETLPRELFVPEKQRSVAYGDRSVDIGQGRYLIESVSLAKMLDEANPKPNDIVLDVCAASGYTSALLSTMVSTVIAVECNKRQIDKANRLWGKLNLCNIVSIENDPCNGAPEHAPYDLIVINGAVNHVPDHILDQIKPGGKLVTVIRTDKRAQGKAHMLMKSSSGDVSSAYLFDSNVPMLECFQQDAAFVF